MHTAEAHYPGKRHRRYVKPKLCSHEGPRRWMSDACHAACGIIYQVRRDDATAFPRKSGIITISWVLNHQQLPYVMPNIYIFT